VPDPLKDIVQRMIDAGESEDNIALVIDRYAHQAPTKEDQLRRLTDTIGGQGPRGDLGEQAPMIGGTIGAMAGGPIGAAAGGAGGTLVRDLLRANRGDVNTPRNPLDAASNIGLNALGQGALSKAGDLLSSGLAYGGKQLYSGLLKAKDATLQRFPKVVDDLMAARVPISQGGRKAVVGRMQALGAEKEGLLKAADDRAMIPRSVMRSGLDDELQTAINTSDAPVKDLDKLAKVERDLLPDEPGVLPSRADKIKTKLQAESDRARRQMQMGTRVNDTGARAKLAVAHKTKDALETIEPKLADVNAAYGSHKGQSMALRDALQRTEKHGPVNMSDMIGGTLGAGAGAITGGGIGAGPGALAGVAMTRALTSPAIGSRAAIGLSDLSKIPYAQLVRLMQLSQLGHQP
jgi:hypothetical protein